MLTLNRRWMMLVVTLGCMAYAACVGDVPNDPAASDGGTDAGVVDDARSSREDANDANDGETAAADGEAGAADAGHDGDGAWTPASLPGLALWLSATNGVTFDDGGGVVAWNDQSPNANHASGGGISTRPTLVANAISSYPAIHFDGLDDVLRVEDSASLQFGTDDFAVVIVAQHTTPFDAGTGYGMMFTKQDSLDPFAGPALLANYWGQPLLRAQISVDAAVETSEGVYNDGAPFVVTEFRLTGGSLTTVGIRVNGVNKSARSGGNYTASVSAAARPLFIGSSGRGSAMQCMRGDIAEIVAIHPVTDIELGAVDKYLRKKYGL
jgi:hypothetical protein